MILILTVYYGQSASATSYIKRHTQTHLLAVTQRQILNCKLFKTLFKKKCRNIFLHVIDYLKFVAYEQSRILFHTVCNFTV